MEAREGEVLCRIWRLWKKEENTGNQWNRAGAGVLKVAQNIEVVENLGETEIWGEEWKRREEAEFCAEYGESGRKRKIQEISGTE